MSQNTDVAGQLSERDAKTASKGPTTVWTDQQGTSWQLELTTEHIRFQHDDEVFLIPASAWQTDVSVTMHRDDAVIRFETFDKSLVFVLPVSKAQPLISQVCKPITTPCIDQATPVPANRLQPILWPNISPLALWALACSALTFVPVVGPIFAVASIVLVIRHRHLVRANRAWEHSRVLCRVAVALVLSGLIVCALATFSLFTQTASPSFDQWRDKTDEKPTTTYNNLSGDEPEYCATTNNVSKIRHLTPGRYSGATPTLFDAAGIYETKPEAIPKLALAASGMPWEVDHNWGLILSGLVVLLLSLTVHEAAHAITAWWLGDDFGKRLGRVTLNPMAHIDPIGTVLLPLILFMTGAGVFGWAKPVPVHTEQLRNPRRDHIFIAAAGPASNLLLAAISLMILLGLVCALGLFASDVVVSNLVTGAFSTSVTVTGIPAAKVVGAICTILQLSFFLNMFLAFFNLIPIPPLDGSWILEHTFPTTLGPIYAKIRPYGFMIFLLAMYTNMLDVVLGYAMYALWPGMWLLLKCPQL